MANFIIMPKLGLNMDTGTLSRWLKKAGEPIAKGEVVCEIETDKTIMEVESSVSGVVLRLLAEEGEVIPVTLPIAVVGKAGEDIADLLAEAAKLLSKKIEAEGLEQRQETVAAAAGVAGTPRRQFISPRARRYLHEHNLQASSITVSGTGPEGALTEADVIRFLQTTAPAGPKRTDVGAPQQPVRAISVEAAAPGAVDERGREILASLPYSGMRRIIGERLSQSMFTAPHLYFTSSVDMSRVLSLQEEFEATQKAVMPLNVLIVRAAAKALQAHPGINASLVGDKIVQYRSVNIGIAVAVQNGLLVPVVKNIQNKTLTELAAGAQQLIDKARAGKLLPEDYQSGTFTVSNLGMFGVENFTAIINPPEAAILSVSSVVKRPVVRSENGADTVVVRPMMNITLSVDHRLIDGLEAVQFLAAVKDNLEKPLGLWL
jgi:pyruvate dehydrogenase E2 component (dihydrolipoamide acetyltransferase)